ncbi:thiol S-methyltransferase TMT1B-like [Rhinophrynus dorsalis]
MHVIILILQLLIALLALPVYILNLLGIWDVTMKKFFPYFMVKFTDLYNKAMEATKKDLFSNLCDFAGPSKELTLLEIGCGTGANFKFYPTGCKVTCLDINPNFQTFLDNSQTMNDHLKFERFVVASADNMSQVADGSMDVVVCTLTVCSVPDTRKVLDEVLRVLKPGGAFYFMEHVASTDDSSWICFFQKILNPTWKLFFDGCNLRKTTWRDLENATFSELKLRHIQAPTLLKPITPHIVGYAVKLLIAFLALPVYILNLLGIWDMTMKKLFPYFMVKFTNMYNKEMEATKKDLFSNLWDFAGPSKELTLLEIGCGTGANFKFYPPGCKIICLDVNPHYQTFLDNSRTMHDHLTFERFVVASADNMSQVVDGSVDVVVCTLTVCSVPDTRKVLDEVLRVLKPGGAFYFMEHVASTDDSSWICFFQKILNPTWKLLLDGCDLRKTIWRDLENAKFSELKLRHIQAPTLLKPITPHIVGYTVK